MASDQQQLSSKPQAATAPAHAATIAWQPFTPSGVARFARASFENLLLIELIVSSLMLTAILWFLSVIWFAGVRDAIQHLPDKGVVRGGLLEWHDEPSRILVENHFLGCAVRADEASVTTLASDVRVEFWRDRLRVCSLFGCVAWPYSPRYIIELNRPEAEPWWGAWRPIILGIVTVAVPLLLLFSWAILAAIYSPIARLIAFYADRDLTWGGSWRLASASLMPGTFLLIMSIFAYGGQTINLVPFLILAGLHIVLGWVYLALGLFSLPRLQTGLPKKNPFAGTA